MEYLSPLTPPSSRPASSGDIILPLFRRKWAVLAIVSVTLLSAMVWLWLIREDRYLVYAKILLRIGHEQAPSSTVLGTPPPNVGSRLQDVNSEVDILANVELLGRLVDSFALDTPAPPAPVPERFLPRLRYNARRLVRQIDEWTNEKLIQLGFRPRLTEREKVIANLQKSLTVVPQKESNIIVARMILPSREGGSKLLNRLLELYQSFRLELYRDTRALSFFQQEVDTLQRKLRSAEVELRTFEDAWDISALERQKEILLEQIAASETALREADIARNDAVTKVQRLEKELASPEPNFASIGAFQANSFPESILLQLAELDKEREKLRMTELDSSPRIQNNRTQFRALLKLMASNLRSVQPERETVYQARKEAMSLLQGKVGTLQDQQMRWTALKRDIRLLEDSYSFYSKKLEESAATAALERQKIGNVVIVEHATDPLIPIGMRKTTMLGLAGLLAVFAALAWVAAAEFFDHRIYTSDALERGLGVPLLGTIPRARSLWWRRSKWPGELNNEYRRAALFLAKGAREDQCRAVMFSSPTAASGTTTAVWNVARHLQESFGMNPLVIEYDLLTPVFLRAFDLDPAKTLEEVASGRLGPREPVQQTSEGVSLIPARGGNGNGREGRWWPATLQKIVQGLNGDFDVILVDGPPILEQPEVLAVGRVVGQVVLVVEAGRTTLEQVDRVTRQLTAENMVITGVILNKHRKYLPGWAYRWVMQ